MRMSPAISPDLTDAQARAVTMSGLETKPVVVIFAEPLLAPSMTFIRAQASALTEFTALYVSPQRASPSLPFPSDRAVQLCDRSEEHTSELQSRLHLVCRLLLEQKNTTTTFTTYR